MLALSLEGFRQRLVLTPHGYPERTEGSAFSSFSYGPWTVIVLGVSPFAATLTSPLQMTEKTVTLSPAFVTLTSFVRHNSFICHSCRKTRGVGVFPQEFLLFHFFALSANSYPGNYPYRVG